MATLTAFNNEISKRGLMDPRNGLLPTSNDNSVQVDPNPFSKYIQGQDVNQNYELDNDVNDMEALTKIANRTDPARILDASNMDPDGVDADIYEVLVAEDKRDPRINFIGLDASDFINHQREANLNAARCANFMSEAPQRVSFAGLMPSEPIVSDFRERARTMRTMKKRPAIIDAEAVMNALNNTNITDSNKTGLDRGIEIVKKEGMKIVRKEGEKLFKEAMEQAKRVVPQLISEAAR